MPTLAVNDDKSKTLYKAAQIVKADLARCENKINSPVHGEDKDLEQADRIVPQSVYSLLKWILGLCDENKVVSGDLSNVLKASNENSHRLILSVGQDLVYGSSKGRVSTPKHVGLAMSVKHLTGSKQVIMMLNRCGHTISYDNLERIETAVAA